MKKRAKSKKSNRQDSSRFTQAYLNIHAYRAEIMVCLALVISIQIVYAQVAGFDFINFDDDLYVYENAIVQAGLNSASITWAFTTFSLGFWIPLTWLSFMSEIHLFGLSPGAHHLTNVTLHILNSLLVFLLLRRMTRALWRSALVAALFALHPLRVESVAWVTERKDVLSTFFALLSIASYIAYSRRPSWKRYLPVAFFMAMALMAKPMFVTLPLLLLFLDYWPLGRLRLDRQGGRSRLGLVIEKLPLVALAAASGVLTFIAHYNQGVVKPSEIYSLPLRMANALISYVSYIAKMVWPRGLAVFYPYDPDPDGWQVAGASGLLIVVTTVAVIRAKRQPYLISGWLWYLVGLLPVIGLVQAGEQARADRFTYVPLTGLFIILVWGAAELTKSRDRGRVAAGLLVAVAIPLLMLCSWRQAGYWRDSATLFARAISVTTDNYLANNNLGTALAEKGKNAEAIARYEEAIRIRPDYGLAHNNLGNALYRGGRIDEAIAQYKEAIRINPRDSKAHNNLGVALADRGLHDEAIAHYREALGGNPANVDAHNNLGNALSRRGSIDEAIASYLKAIQIDPQYGPAHFNLGEALARKGEVEKAIGHFARAVEINPDDREAQTRLSALESARRPALR